MASLKETLEADLTDPLLQIQLITKALNVLAVKLDNDGGVTDQDYNDVVNAVTL